MAHRIGDRIKEQASTSGTSAFTFSGALAGFKSFASLLTADGDTTWYCAFNGDEWEEGIGTRTGAATMSRNATPLASSNGNATVNFSAAPIVFCTVPTAALLVNGPAFSATQNVAQNVTSALSKLTFATEENDTNGCYDPALSRFQPTTPGYYNITGAISYAAKNVGNTLISLYKNGVEYRRGTQVEAGVYGITVAVNGVYLNGTTDYVELWGYSSSTAATAAAAAQNYFSATMARAA